MMRFKVHLLLFEHFCWAAVSAVAIGAERRQMQELSAHFAASLWKSTKRLTRGAICDVCNVCGQHLPVLV
jgi:hypothetical protein